MQTEALRSRADTHGQTLPITCVCLSGALPALPFMKTASGTRARQAGWGLDVTGAAGLDPGGAFCTHPTASPCKQNYWDAVNLQKLKWNLCRREKWFLIPNERNVRDLSKVFFLFSNSCFIFYVRMKDVSQHLVENTKCRVDRSPE